MNANGFTFDELRLECLDREPVQGGRAIEQNGMSTSDFFEDVPNFGRLTFDHFLGRTNGMNVVHLFEPANDERLEENEGHLFGQTALMELEFGTDDDDRTAGVIDALA